MFLTFRRFLGVPRELKMESKASPTPTPPLPGDLPGWSGRPFGAPELAFGCLLLHSEVFLVVFPLTTFKKKWPICLGRPNLASDPIKENRQICLERPCPLHDVLAEYLPAFVCILCLILNNLSALVT